MSTNDETELMTLPGLSRALRLPAQFLKHEANLGRIPCLRVGRRMLFNLAAVRGALAERAAGKRPGRGSKVTLLGAPTDER